MILSSLRATADRPFDLLGLGESSIDLVYRLPVLLHQTLPSKVSALAHEVLSGGQIATACTAAARLGKRVRFAGAIGMDDAGQALLNELSEEGVDTSFVRRCEGAKTRSAVLLCDKTGERSVVEWRDPALSFSADFLSDEALAKTRVLHVDLCFPTASVAAAKRARDLGVLVSVDLDRPLPLVEELLALTDLCVVSEAFPTLLTGHSDGEKAVRALSKKTNGKVIVTLGARGCWFLQQQALRTLPAFAPPTLVDTTACGDTFHAALVCALLDAAGQTAPKTDVRADDEAALLSAIRFASAAAALKCGDFGRRGCPTLPQVLRFLGTFDGAI